MNEWIEYKYQLGNLNWKPDELREQSSWLGTELEGKNLRFKSQLEQP